jgi:succinylarginine dihydrolase
MTVGGAIVGAREFNFDGLVGPTHNYAGLSFGNVASTTHRHQVASPKTAALEGLAKMRFLHRREIPQAILPPQRRPYRRLLAELGLCRGREIDLSAAREHPEWLAAAYSASSMWTANAATVSPSADCADGRVHFTPANLVSNLHRSIEAAATARVLCDVFGDPAHFVVHAPLPASATLSDEGAANHARLCAGYGRPGLELFVYGREATRRSADTPSAFPARQTREACEAIARRHRLDAERAILVQQSPAAIDAGVFHNDVIGVANLHVLLCHAQAYVDQTRVMELLAERFAQICGGALAVVEIPASLMSLQEAVASYLFNSQLVTAPDGTMTLLCPRECHDQPAARAAIRYIVDGDNPIEHVHYFDLRQSMHNGGGPACLRLRVVLTEPQARAMHQGIVYTDELGDQLEAWVQRHYRDELRPADLFDPHLPLEVDKALAELSGLLNLPCICPQDELD